jgi:hypothetical protein
MRSRRSRWGDHANSVRYLIEDRDRHGNIRVYVRVPGRRKVRIRAPFGTDKFIAAYNAAISEYVSTPRQAPAAKTGLRVSLAEFNVQVQASVPRPPCRLCRNRVSQLGVGSPKGRDRNVACFHRAAYRHWINILDSVIQDEE